MLIVSAVVSLLVSLLRDPGKHARRSALRPKFAVVPSSWKKNLQGLRSLPVCVELVAVVVVVSHTNSSPYKQIIITVRRHTTPPPLLFLHSLVDQRVHVS